MTDKQHDTRQDTQKAAGDKGREGERTNGSRQPRNTQQEQASGGQAEGKQTGREERGARMASRLGEWWRGAERDGRHTAAGREQGETERKKSM